MKYIFDEAKFRTLVSEYKDTLNENPAALAAAAMAATKIRNDQGKQIQATTALKNPNHSQHKKAKGIFARLKDKFKRKTESTKEYEKSLAKMANDRTLKMLSKKDKQSLLKIAQLLQKEKGMRESSSEEKQVLKYLIKYGNNPQHSKQWVKKHYKKAKGDRSKATPAELAQYISFLTANESMDEARKMRFDKDGNRIIPKRTWLRMPDYAKMKKNGKDYVLSIDPKNKKRTKYLPAVIEGITAGYVLSGEKITYEDDNGNEKEISAITAYNNPDHPVHDEAERIYNSKKKSAEKDAKRTVKKGLDKAASSLEKAAGEDAKI